MTLKAHTTKTKNQLNYIRFRSLWTAKKKKKEKKKEKEKEKRKGKQ